MNSPRFNDLGGSHGEENVEVDSVNDSGDSHARKSSEGRSVDQKDMGDLLQGMRLLLEGQQRLEDILSRQMGVQPAFFSSDRDLKATPEPSVRRQGTTPSRASSAFVQQSFEIRPEVLWRPDKPQTPEQLQMMWDSFQFEDNDEGNLSCSLGGGSSLALGNFRHPNAGGVHVPVRMRRLVCLPMSPARAVMDLLSIAVLVYDLLSLPLLFAFEIPLEGTLLYLAAGSVSFWILDVLFRFRTGYFCEDCLEMRPSRIAMNYLRTSFPLDFSLVALDIVALCLSAWGSFESSNETDAFKICRISKISRIMRCVGFLRLRVMADIRERLCLHGTFLQATSVVVYDVARIVLAILWLNHVIACGWIGLGRSVASTTGVTWLDTPIGGGAPADATYAACGHVYQYLTAFHWALTQMTPGSMQVFPVNSAERLFNNIGLIFGVLVFSTLISSITSTVTQFKLAMQTNNANMDRLNRFLAKKGVSRLLSMQVRKKVKEKLGFQKPLVLKDIEAFEWLPLSMQVTLRRELCSPHLRRHCLFNLMLEADELAAEELCRTCADFSVLGRGDTLFLAGTHAVGMHFLVGGSLSYSVETRSRRRIFEALPVADQSQEVQKGEWLSEPALWCNWRHTGSAEVPPKVSCEILSMTAESLARFLRGAHGACGPLCSAYAHSFCAFLNASFAGPRTEWPTDTRLPFLLDEVVAALPSPIKGYLGRVALKVLKRNVIHRRGWMSSLSEAFPDVEKIQEEVHTGQGATLVATSRCRWGVSRFSSLVALKVRRFDEKVLVVFGHQEQRRLGDARLPRLRLQEEQLPEHALQRLLSEYFGGTSSCVVFEGVERLSPVVESVGELGVTTVQSMYIFHARWEPAGAAEGREDAGAGHPLCSSPRSRRPSGLSDACPVFSGSISGFIVAETFLLPSGVPAAWVTDEELHRCVSELSVKQASPRDQPRVCD